MGYTKGPWSYSGYDDHCQVGRRYHEVIDSRGFEVVNQNGIVTNGNDARLIAAAPNLYEAAEALLIDAMDRGECYDDETGEMYDDYGALYDAIKKVKGV